MNGAGASSLPICLPIWDDASQISVNVVVWYDALQVQRVEVRSQTHCLDVIMPKIELGVEATFWYCQLGVAVEPRKHNGSIRHRAVWILIFQSSPNIEHGSIKSGSTFGPVPTCCMIPCRPR